jgi:hypothetical protein
MSQPQFTFLNPVAKTAGYIFVQMSHFSASLPLGQLLLYNPPFRAVIVIATFRYEHMRVCIYSDRAWTLMLSVT